MDRKIGFWERIKAYKLRNNVIVLAVLIVVFIVSLIMYIVPEFRQNEIVSNILIALFTSLLATIFAMFAEIYVSFKSHKNDRILEDIHSFGVEGFHKDKQELLKSLLQDCDKTIWISGYRLILTRNINEDIYNAIMRGAEVTAVICPPWSDSFKMVYGKNEKVADNYLQVFHNINKARIACKKRKDEFRIVFIDKPLFSDTYRVDQYLVSGPYMHNATDDEYHRITAKDFFTYNLIKKSELYELIDGEYRTLFRESNLILDWDKFEEVYKESDASDFRECDKVERLRQACVEFNGANARLD